VCALPAYHINNLVKRQNERGRDRDLHTPPEK
jgi:hypothetical protein